MPKKAAHIDCRGLPACRRSRPTKGLNIMDAGKSSSLTLLSLKEGQLRLHHGTAAASPAVIRGKSSLWSDRRSQSLQNFLQSFLGTS